MGGGMLLALSLLASEAEAGDVGFMCMRHVGPTGGLIYAPGSWERIGRAPWFLGGGFVVGTGCSVDVENFMVWGSLDYTILYPHYVSKDNLQHDWLQVTIGASGGSPHLWAGGHVIGDLRPVGAGAHLIWLPGDERARQRQGLEVRLNGYWIIQPNFQVQLMYTMASANTRKASTRSTAAPAPQPP